jgi:D-xylose transport system ATP-binding protein
VPPASSSPVFAVEGVSKSFGSVHALDGVDFEVHSGEVVALVGDNGAGKSTLVKVMSGIYRPDSGRLLFEGRPVTIARPSDATRLGIAAVHQDLALADNLDVVENLFLGRELIAPGLGRVLRALDETGMEQRTRDLLAGLAVTIPNVRAEVGTMSGGQRQQVAIARPLLADPRVVILDEPTAALGVRQTAQVLDLIRQLRAQGQGVVVISHNLADVFSVADRIVVLRLGQEAGDFQADEVSEERVVAAITGADTQGGER